VRRVQGAVAHGYDLGQNGQGDFGRGRPAQFQADWRVNASEVGLTKPITGQLIQYGAAFGAAADHWVSPGFTRKSTLRNAKSADFKAVFAKMCALELDSPASAVDPSRYRPLEMISGLFEFRVKAKASILRKNTGALADNYGRFREIP